MKIVRFASPTGKVSYGELCGDEIKGFAVGPFDRKWNIDAPVYDGSSCHLHEAKLLVPCEPSKFVGVGLNFPSAAAAMNRECPDYPITFIKPTGSVIAAGEDILLPRAAEDFFYEGEMAVVIGKTARCVNAEDAKNYILGCTCANDVTDMGFFGRDDLKTKAADTFGPTGPCIDTTVDFDNCIIRSWVNGELRQEGCTGEMKFKVSWMIEFLSSYMTLYPGDIISMGTPAGIGNIKPGDIICVEVEGVGRLVNRVLLK